MKKIIENLLFIGFILSPIALSVICELLARCIDKIL